MADTLSTPPPLASRHADMTQRIILDAAVALLEEASVAELTVRAVAGRAGISERTVFRYFANRDELLDAVIAEYVRRVDLPPDPGSAEELPGYAAALYTRFEANGPFTRAILHSELFDRVRGSQAQRRWESVRRAIERAAPGRTPQERSRAAANIRYFLSATTWNYYRVYFGFPIGEAIACADTAIRQALAGLGVRLQAQQSGNKRTRQRG